MPKGGPCEHPRCQGNATGCKMLTDEEMRPGPEDEELGRRLVADGWLSTSTKFRRVGRVLPGHSAEDLLRPEVLDTPAGRHFADLWRRELRFVVRSSEPFVEHLELTFKQYAAFRAAGGQTA